jgi:class 3 adenylate cyclase/CHASE2 domain-containing sensor protein
MNVAVTPRASKVARGKKFLSVLTLSTVAILSALISFIAVERFDVLTSLDNVIQDWEISRLIPPKPIYNDIVILAVNENTLRQFQYRSPLDRAFLSKVLKRVAEGKPKAIGLDFLFDQPTEPAKDAELKATLADLPVPLVVAYTENPSIVTPPQLAYLRSYVPLSRRAMANVAKDQHGTARLVFPGEKDADGRYIVGFDHALAAYAGVKTNAGLQPIVWTRPPAGEKSAFPEFEAQAVDFFPPQLFANKIVLIGSDESLVDRHRTPFTSVSDKGTLAGIVIHAYSVATLLHPQLSPYTGWGVNIAIAVLLSILGAILGLLTFNLVLRVATLLVILAAFWVGGAMLCMYANTIIGLLAPSIAAIASFSIMDSLSGRDARKQRQFIQGAFSRYVSPKVVEALIADPSRMSLEGERREMTYLFTDVANFTTMAEKVDSKELAPMINSYFEGVTSVVLRHGGMVDKFIGDAVFAIFNAPVDLPDHAQHAVQCAMEIDAFCEDFRKKRNAEGIDLGVTRVGVHTGAAIIGNFGSSSRFNYTAQGDAVNVAARLEGLNKQLGTRVCVSGNTKVLCPDIGFRPIASVVLKGKGLPVEVWEPLPDGVVTAARLERYHAAFGKLREAPEEALALFGELDQESPGDPCVRFHLRRLREGLKGVDLVMTEK